MLIGILCPSTIMFPNPFFLRKLRHNDLSRPLAESTTYFWPLKSSLNYSLFLSFLACYSSGTVGTSKLQTSTDETYFHAFPSLKDWNHLRRIRLPTTTAPSKVYLPFPLPITLPKDYPRNHSCESPSSW